MKKLMISALALVALASCNKEEVTVDNWNGEIRLASGVEVLQTRVGDTAPDTQIASDQEIGVFIYEDIAAATVISENLSYTADGAGALTLGGTQPYYPQSGNDVKIYAYHPYVADIQVSHTHTVATDQSTATNYYAADLLYSTSEEYARQPDAHSLNFTHKLSKLVCKLTAGTGTPDLANATVEVMGVTPDVTFAHATGVVSLGSATDVEVKLNNTAAISATTTTYAGIIPPQTFEAAKFLKVTLSNGGMLYYTLPSALEVTEGKVYTYNITVNLSSLSVTSTITDWETVGAVDGTATME